MMEDRQILIEDRGDIRIVSLNIPERRNAVSAALRVRLFEAFAAAERDDAVRCIILTGTGDIFCAGGDIGGMAGRTVASGLAIMRETNRLIRQMLTLRKPIIAAVEGWAVGAGLSLALACDTIVANEQARFLAGFGQIGLIADMGLLHTLPRRIGIAATKQFLFYGEKMEAGEALRLGLVDRLAPAGGALTEALTCATRLAAQAPLPLALTKSILAEGLDALLDREGEIQTMLFQSADHQEGRAAFLEKRQPVFIGR